MYNNLFVIILTFEIGKSSKILIVGENIPGL